MSNNVEEIKRADEKTAICFYILSLSKANTATNYNAFLRVWNNNFNRDFYYRKNRMKEEFTKGTFSRAEYEIFFKNLFNKSILEYADKKPIEIEQMIYEIRKQYSKPIPDSIYKIANNLNYRITQKPIFKKTKKRQIGKCCINLCGYKIEHKEKSINKKGKEVISYKFIKGYYYELTADDVIQFILSKESANRLEQNSKNASVTN